MFNLSPLFHKDNEVESFLVKLQVPKKQKDDLFAAKSAIKKILTEGIKEFTGSEQGGGKVVSPKFHTQGSWSYKTVNSPCHIPPQQIDYDYGTYLPVSYLNNEGPKVAAKLFFAAVDSLLNNLAQKKGWELDRSKKTCSRIILDKYCHIDIPLYAIPDDAYHELSERALARGYSSLSDAIWEFHEKDWLGIDSDKIMLAMRDGDWVQSDPLKLHKWFLNEVAVRGEQIRRVCRYLKAWRDFHWKSGGPSSIFLMVCTSMCFKNKNGRDDLSLLSVLESLPNLLMEPIDNPTDRSECLSDRIKAQDINKLKDLSYEFFVDFSNAINETDDPLDACDLVIKHLGNRFPKTSKITHEDFRSKVLGVTPIIGKTDEIPKRTKAG